MIDKELYTEIDNMSRYQLDFEIAKCLRKNASLEEDGVWIYPDVPTTAINLNAEVSTSFRSNEIWQFSPTSNLEYGEDLLNEYIGKVEAKGKLWYAFYVNDRSISFSAEHYLFACMKVVLYAMKKSLH